MSSFDVSALKKNINRLAEEKTPRESSDDAQSGRNESVTVVNHTQEDRDSTTILVTTTSSLPPIQPELPPRNDIRASDTKSARKLLKVNWEYVRSNKIHLGKADIQKKFCQSLEEKVEKHRQARRIERKRESLEDISKDDSVKHPKLAKFDFDEILKEIAKQLGSYSVPPPIEISEKQSTTVGVLEKDNKKWINIGSSVDKVLPEVVDRTCSTKAEIIAPTVENSTSSFISSSETVDNSFSTTIPSSNSSSETVDTDAGKKQNNSTFPDLSF